MKRWLILVAALALALSSTSMAQGANAKAYAPENLSRLAQPDQIRVLEKQYAELAGGRQLPEDQLEFYLEQIQRGWTYAQITQDMVQSIRDRVDGVTFPNQQPPGGWNTPGWTTDLPDRGGIIECQSSDRRYKECATGFRNPPQIQRQISSTRCVEGSNWGHRPGLVWVSGGCRATFVERAPAIGVLPQVTCQSVRGYRECNVPFRGPASLVRQISGSGLCIEGRTWGQREGKVWVDRGCSGVFSEGYQPSVGFYKPDEFSGFLVDCASLNNAYGVCSWDPRTGPPFLREQYSLSPCIEGITWGYSDRRGLWVDAGCRARFGARR